MSTAGPAVSLVGCGGRPTRSPSVDGSGESGSGSGDAGSTTGDEGVDDTGSSIAPEVDVVVVGGGLAGLTAAHQLMSAGLSVQVLEARDRVGGRTQDWDLGGGHVAEGGAQWVAPTQTAVLDLAAEYGIETFAGQTEGNLMVSFGGVGMDVPLEAPGPEVLEIYALVDAVAATIPLSSPWAAPDAAALDAQTVSEWMMARGVSAELREEVGISIAVALGDPDRLSMLYFAFYVASAGSFAALADDAQQLRLVGGTQQLSLRMAEDLGDVVATGVPVERIVDHGDEVEVFTASATVSARRVVVAMMPADVDRIEFEPPLPEQRKALQERWSSSAGAKLHVVYETPFWRDAGLSGMALSDLPICGLTFDGSPPDASLGVLIVFPNDANLPETVEQRRAAVVDELVQIFGPDAADAISYQEKDWALDPWTAGCVSPLEPGVLSQYGAALRAPVGRVHWAGTETSEVWTGYMDGAVRSGRRVAVEVGAAILG